MQTLNPLASAVNIRALNLRTVKFKCQLKHYRANCTLRCFESKDVTLLVRAFLVGYMFDQSLSIVSAAVYDRHV